jgi:hypothetical protein
VLLSHTAQTLRAKLGKKISRRSEEEEGMSYLTHLNLLSHNALMHFSNSFSFMALGFSLNKKSDSKSP